jgi:transposase
MMRQSKLTMPKEALKALRGESARERLLHRLHSVALVINGASASQAARIYGDSLRAVAYWVKRFKQQGIEGLQEVLRPGRPPRLNAAHRKKVQTFLRRSAAKRKSVRARMLAEYILREFGISLTTRQCWRILKQLKT